MSGHITNQELEIMKARIARLEKYIQVLADKAGVDLSTVHV